MNRSDIKLQKLGENIDLMLQTNKQIIWPENSKKHKKEKCHRLTVWVLSRDKSCCLKYGVLKEEVCEILRSPHRSVRLRRELVVRSNSDPEVMDEALFFDICRLVHSARTAQTSQFPEAFPNIFSISTPHYENYSHSDQKPMESVYTNGFILFLLKKLKSWGKKNQNKRKLFPLKQGGLRLGPSDPSGTLNICRCPSRESCF